MKEPQLVPTIVPAEPGWENLGWFDGRLFSNRIIAWRSELKQCEEHGIEEHVTGTRTPMPGLPTAIRAGGFSLNPVAFSKARLS